VACEACSNAFWVADTLEPLVRKIHVGDTKKIRWIAEARIKTDKIDAGILAELLRVDLFPSIGIPPRRVRELRELSRGLVRMKRQAVRCRNQVHGLLGRHGVPYKRKESWGERIADIVRAAGLSWPAQLAAESLLRMEQAALLEMRGLQRAIMKELRAEPEIRGNLKLLETIPGVGFISALFLVLELWDITRFRDPEHLASYVGLVPSTHQTGETLWHGRMTKQGNVFIRWLIFQDAWAASRNNLFFAQVHERHRAKLGNKRAIVPVARKLLSTIWKVWSEGKPYEEIYGKKSLVG
jgi:transposase